MASDYRHPGNTNPRSRSHRRLLAGILIAIFGAGTVAAGSGWMSSGNSGTAGTEASTIPGTLSGATSSDDNSVRAPQGALEAQTQPAAPPVITNEATPSPQGAPNETVEQPAQDSGDVNVGSGINGILPNTLPTETNNNDPLSAEELNDPVFDDSAYGPAYGPHYGAEGLEDEGFDQGYSDTYPSDTFETDPVYEDFPAEDLPVEDSPVENFPADDGTINNSPEVPPTYPALPPSSQSSEPGTGM